MEIWKEVLGYDTRYEVSNFGRIRAYRSRNGKVIETPRIIKPLDNGNGYLRLNLKKKGQQKTVYIHKLVAEAFIDNPMCLREVNHIDENKQNNRADNLEWCTHKENCRYGTRNQRTAEKKRKSVMCVETGVVYSCVREAAEMLGVCKSAISNAINGLSKTCRGCHWKYAEI